MQADAERCLHAAQVNALKDAGIYEKTALILTSKHGNSPIIHSEVTTENAALDGSLCDAWQAPRIVMGQTTLFFACMSATPRPVCLCGDGWHMGLKYL